MGGGIAVGIDVGGTFTDLAAVGADGYVQARKVLSTPRDQSEGVVASLDALGAAAGTIARIVHGTTVVTNTLLERSGARVVLCATQGATDLLELRRQERASLYDLSVQHPAPLVDASDVIGVPERLAVREGPRSLSPADAARVAGAAVARGGDIIAIALLHGYGDPAHERMLRDAIRDARGDIDVVLASDVLPEIREYERTATATAEAYVRPRVSLYLRRLAASLDSLGYPAPGVMTSSGGMLPAAEAAARGASLALSGPAGGVTGAAELARAAGIDLALTIDIGGTSADVGLIMNGEPLVEAGGNVAGVPIALPRVLVETVSAGGGSIAWIDDAGVLRAGPRSAGALPGPAAFGRGGTEATVTDAHLSLGNIAATSFNTLALRRDLATDAVGRIAARLGVEPKRAAAAIVDVADAEMARALRRVSVERGVDPRHCTLVAFGGGGPLHACGLADRLEMRRIFVPPHAGVLSAVGLALAPERRESAGSFLRRARDVDAAVLGAMLKHLESSAGTATRQEWRVRTRYAGQGHELEVAARPGDDGAQLARRFAELHDQRFGFVLDREVEFVSVRYAAIGDAVEVHHQRRGVAFASETGAIVVDTGAPLSSSVRGRAVVALPDATMLIADGWTARALEIGGWILERE